MRLNTIVILLIILVLIGCVGRSPQYIESPVGEEGSLDAELNRLTNQIIKSLAEERRTKIAIVEFTDLYGNVPMFGKYVSEELITRMYTTRRFEVVERQMLNRVLEEQKLGTSGLIDESSAAAIGRMLGVQAIATGTITDLGDRVRINARMITTEKAEVFAVASVTVIKEDYIANMMTAYETTPLTIQRTTEPNSGENVVGISKQTLAQTTVDDVEFEIISARLTNDNKVVIEVLITNKSHSDKEIGICSSSTIYDNFGQEYSTPVRKIGQKSQSSPYSYLTHLFISNVPTRLSLEFNTVDPNADSISLFDMSMHNHANVNLRHFPLEK